MGDPKGFMTVPRTDANYRPVKERVYDYGEVEQTLNEKDRQLQASRCMDCGIPFCHWGCPVGSKIPEWQDAVYKGDKEEAYYILHSTNSFPEITGRICPAPCEKSCVLAIHEEAVTIRENECATVEQAFDAGIIKPNPPKVRTGKRVAVIGSGPAGLAAADLLNRAGHSITVFEKNDAIGGLLRYGIPDFKLNKRVIDRRLEIFIDEGIEFKINVNVGVDISKDELLAGFDAVLLAVGAEQPRDLPVEGRELNGVHFAMDFLSKQNKTVAGQVISDEDQILAKDKNVLVIGGGDTGSDCVGTSIRQKAKSVTQIEILPKPPEKRELNNPWPYWPETLRTTSSHKEGCERRWSLNTKRFIGENGKLKQAEIVQVEWEKDKNGRWKMNEVPGTNEIVDVELVLLSMGFTQPVHAGLLESIGVDFDQRGNVLVNENKQTSIDKIFAAGDVEKGASLVVHAIQAGNVAAKNVDEFLREE
ncbi:MAG: glutamate synthase subunit beta [Prolixibacteraceae bacterium]|jgi:glutamate synthase (NADPH) small chain|nr:glutamate synthase subunit beta [Prolixibacteraceae bacterium]MBT6004225.1 glutamate synthase subunit beta [Prolixibacteraceae bacterium]MBT6766046.1 glutamate synthase subunit beta [Prolixibacteraceae bacterium]MBT6998636.1 glutamate synthase subunit beta [Prolixibacteraceae bacterium]MBT7397437.1 glutamate synthase subunit beta [Prolixibacteraceae bacterium]